MHSIKVSVEAASLDEAIEKITDKANGVFGDREFRIVSVNGSFEYDREQGMFDGVVATVNLPRPEVEGGEVSNKGPFNNPLFKELDNDFKNKTGHFKGL